MMYASSVSHPEAVYENPAYLRAMVLTMNERLAGRWLTDKARQWADDSGHYQAARNLRKWNVPLELALTLLL